jgi:hypothetical protein
MPNEDLINTTDQYNKISSIVDHVIESHNYTQAYFAKFLGFAKWGFKELKLDQAQEVKTVRKTISDTKTVTLDNCIDYVKVAVPCGQYLKTLSVNANLSKEERTLGNPPLTEQWPLDSLPNGIDFGQYGGYFFANYNGHSLFSIGGGVPAEGVFQFVDRGHGCKEILLDVPLNATELVIETISDGIHVCGETIVHSYLADYVKKYIEHEIERTRPTRERNESAIYRTGREVADALTLVRGRTSNLRPKDMLNISRKYYAIRSKA